MSITQNEIQYRSADGIHTIVGRIYRPDTEPRAVLQISHGMIEHFGRYEDLALFFASHGFVVAGNDHLGHGKSAGKPEDFGFFAEKDGVDKVLFDLHTMNCIVRKQYPNLPVVLLGHSMGSFIVRLFVEKYTKDIDALIIHGTGGPNPLLPVGKALAASIEALYGSRYRSRLIANMAFAGYNAKFGKNCGVHAWLSRDTAYVEDYEKDPYTQFIFTISGYRDLFRMVGGCNSNAWFMNYPKDMPTLVISGTADPVGDFGKGPDYVYKHLLMAGVGKVSLKMYEGARHELMHETNAEEVKNDLLAWAESVIG